MKNLITVLILFLTISIFGQVTVIENGNVGVGDEMPKSKLSVDGLSEATSFGVYNEELGNFSRVMSPDGGSYYTGQQQVSGAYKITLPQGWNSTMLKMKVELFNYKSDENLTLNLGGYNYAGNGGSWERTSAYIEGHGDNFESIYVSFDKVDGLPCIFIGDKDTEWLYGRISITDVLFFSSNGLLDDWDDGWGIDLDNNYEPSGDTYLLTRDLDTDILNERHFTNNNGTLMDYPYYQGFGASETGAIAIQLPVGWSNTMMKLTVEVYNYVTNTSFEYNISGYNYLGGYWVNASVSGTGDVKHKIRFGYDSVTERNVIYIGELNTSWKNAKVHITKALLTHSNFQIDKWIDGWDIYAEDQTYKQVSASLFPTISSNWKKNNIGLYSEEKVTIGKVANNQNASLYVKGRTINEFPSSKYNSLVGFGSGHDDMTGNYNVINGVYSGNNLSTGNGNVLLGFETGRQLNSGYNNVFLGWRAGKNTSNRANNVIIGTDAGNSNSGNSNIIMGVEAGYNNSGAENVILGVNAGTNNTGQYNYISGYYAGRSNTGNYNNFMGYFAGNENTSGSDNTFIGAKSGRHNTIGQGNVYFGFESGLYNTTGSWNMNIGQRSGYSNSTGSSNVNIGHIAGYNNVNGDYNVNIGFEAGYNNLESNRLHISNKRNNTLIYGEFDNSKVEINGGLELKSTANMSAILTLEPLNTVPSGPSVGTIYFDQSLDTLRIYTSTGWKSISLD